jgi:adenylate cyclase class 2
MAQDGQELEVKLYVARLEPVVHKLESFGGRLTHSRKLETNLRFDTPERDLSRSYQALRLRHYEVDRVTYKGPSEFVEGVRSRREIEFSVDNFDAARELFESLGFHVFFIYEKYRAAYEVNGVEVSVDELPYGKFIEIEGNDAGKIRAVAVKLGLNWEARISESYTALFENLRKRLDLPFGDLTFENFAGKQISHEELGVRLADKPG